MWQVGFQDRGGLSCLAPGAPDLPAMGARLLDAQVGPSRGVPVPERDSNGALRNSGCAPLVPVVKTADLRDSNDPSEFRRLHGPRFRRVLGQGEVRPGFVIIRKERLHMPVQRGIVEDDQVIQALSPNCADDAFRVGSLPRRARSRKDFLDSHGFHILPKLTAEDAVLVPQEVAWDLLKGESLGKASRSCWAVHSAVGCAVTLKCTMRLRS